MNRKTEERASNDERLWISVLIGLLVLTVSMFVS